MKKNSKLCAVILAGLTLCGSFALSGCSDFGFNPIGEWVNVSTTLNGEQIETPYGEDAEFCFIFRHDGTAYMTLNGDYIEKTNFTYSYTDDKIIMKSLDREGAYAEYNVKDDGNTIESVTEIGMVNTYKRK